jgi:hypothetical protein
MIQAGSDTDAASAIDSCIMIAENHGVGLGKTFSDPNNTALHQIFRAMIDARIAELAREGESDGD